MSARPTGRTSNHSAQSIRGQKILITAGPTREYWDPVRYLTNASTGAMGIALAKEAARRGGQVTLVLGPTAFDEIPQRTRVVPVVSAWDMYQAVKKHLPGTDTFIGTAAVVDYRPAQMQRQKIKHHNPTMTLRLHGNPDIIAMVGHRAKGRPRSVIGFALETDHAVENARDKLLRKKLDWIMANPESNMASQSGAGTLLSRWGHRIAFRKMSKDEMAKKIWQTVLS